MSVDNRLNEAFIRLYDVFSIHRNFSKDFGKCSWLNDQDRRILKEKSPKQLSADELSAYFDHLSFCGTADDFKHFLPRCLELLFEGAFRLGPQFYLMTLPATLNDAEKTAIDAVFDVFWDKFIHTFPFPFAADELLCGFAHIYSDLMPFFRVWGLADSPESLRQLAMLSGEATYCGGWENRPAQMRQMIDWLLHDSTIQKLADGALKFADEPYDFELLEAVETLNKWRLSYPDGNRTT